MSGQSAILNSLLFFLLLAASAAGAAEEDYLRALEAEAARIDAPPASVPEAGPEERGPAGRDRAAFESELRRHKGTYSFYQSLLEKDKAEVFKAYQEGASLARIRKMIVSRKLNR